MDFVRVAEDEQDQEPIEIPVEQDGTILLSTVTAQYPGACGLKYRSDRGTWRGLRLVEGRLQFPGEAWEDVLYIVVFPKGASENKRKGEESAGNPAGKTRKLEVKKNQDLVVLGLPWKSTEEELKAYFEQYGEVVFSEVRSKHFALDARVSKLEGMARRKGSSREQEEMAPVSPSGLDHGRLETSLDALSHCTQQLHQQVEVLKSHKRQQDHLPPSEVTSLELSLSLLERCLQHLRTENPPPTPLAYGTPYQTPQQTPHQTPSDLRCRAFNAAARTDCPESSTYRRNAASLPQRMPSSVGGQMHQRYMLERAVNQQERALRGSLPLVERDETRCHRSPPATSADNEYEDWFEYDSSCDANSTMAAKIKSLVGNPKWGHLQYQTGATELTRSLAHILYSKEELILSTITGKNGFEALDNVKIMAIREAVEKKYSHITSDFEALWKHCLVSLGQHCKYLRQKASGCQNTPLPCYGQDSPEQKPSIDDLQQTVIIGNIQ